MVLSQVDPETPPPAVRVTAGAGTESSKTNEDWFAAANWALPETGAGATGALSPPKEIEVLEFGLSWNWGFEGETVGSGASSPPKQIDDAPAPKCCLGMLCLSF